MATWLKEALSQLMSLTWTTTNSACSISHCAKHRLSGHTPHLETETKPTHIWAADQQILLSQALRMFFHRLQ